MSANQRLINKLLMPKSSISFADITLDFLNLDSHRNVYSCCLQKPKWRLLFLFPPSNFILCRVKGKQARTDLRMTGLSTLCACCRQIPEPCLPSGAHKSLRGMNETDIKETNCGVMCTNKTPLTISYGTPQFLG